MSKNGMLDRLKERAAEKEVIAPATPKPSPFVRVAVQVTARERDHYFIQARQQGVTLSEAIREALAARFGTPD